MMSVYISGHYLGSLSGQVEQCHVLQTDNSYRHPIHCFPVQFYLSIFLYVLTPEGDIRRVLVNHVLGFFFFFFCAMLVVLVVSERRQCLPYNAERQLGPNMHWTSNYGTGIVFIGNMLSWLSFHNVV